MYCNKTMHTRRMPNFIEVNSSTWLYNTIKKGIFGMMKIKLSKHMRLKLIKKMEEILNMLVL